MSAATYRVVLDVTAPSDPGWWDWSELVVSEPGESVELISVTARPAVDHDPRVTTWADGFGVWHVRVSRNAAAPLLAARRAIRDELQARAPRGTVIPRRCWVPLVEAPDYSDANTIVYREPLTDDERPNMVALSTVEVDATPNAAQAARAAILAVADEMDRGVL